MAILGVDVGGTFTDAVLLDGEELRTAKVPTARRQEESVLAAVEAVGAGELERFTHGTTIATNALLERRGARTALVATDGFEHVLHLRRQDRAHLYRLCAQHPEPLVPLERCHGVRGRIAQAEHIPVHLGAMPASVAAVIACDPAPDDVFILNDPYAGGTHLPDITLVSRTELGFAATRAHHADVGGAAPGSMPADSRTLAEEGVVIPPTRLDERTLAALVEQMRNPDERRGDLRAQLAAQRLGARRIAELCARRGRAEVIAAMDELVAYSERRVRAGVAALPDGRYEAAERLETADGQLELRAAVAIRRDELEIDFAGTAPQHECGLPRQRYYETIGDGQGACPDADGPSGVHVAMSNTLSTPTEALELAYPIRVERYARRLGSGGAGVHRGGDGVVRELRVLERCRLSLLSQRRRTAPAGASGGDPGLPGRNLRNGVELPPFVSLDFDPGDVLTIETPGGGGYGST